MTSVSPNSGTTAGGTAVTLTGTNFVTGATVTFGGTAATNVVVVSSTSITATTPAHAAGAVTVAVTNPGGLNGSLANGFTYIGTPTVTSVSPNNGPTGGGTAVTITGTNFATGATVTFGSAAATNVAVVSSTSITATTPAGSAGAVTVTVTNPGGLAGSLANGFTYTTQVAIGFVQVAAATPQSPVATVPVTYPGAQTQGNLNVVVVGWNDTTSTVQSVHDSAGNTYSLAVGPTSGTGLRESIYYAANIVGGSNTVTVTFSQAAAFPDVRVSGVSRDHDAGCDGGSERKQRQRQQWVGDDDERERVDLRSQHGGDGERGRRYRLHVADHHEPGRGSGRGQDGNGSGEQQRDSDTDRCRTLGDADGDVLGGVGTVADGDKCVTEQWVDGRRDGSNDHGHELRGGSDGDVR